MYECYGHGAGLYQYGDRQCQKVRFQSSVDEKVSIHRSWGKIHDRCAFPCGGFAISGFFINLLYIVMKLVSGILYRSTWFIALAVYYILLAVMRFLLVRRLNVQDEVSELRRYRLCGVMLLFMNQALADIVIFMVHQNQGFDYPGLLIYAMAAYAFYAVILAIVNVVKTRRHNSPILSAAKAINLVAAMVSILSLETAMLAQFGGMMIPCSERP